MDEDRLVRVLEEIRDLQRRQVEAYARALANQEEALRGQRENMVRARRALGAVAVIIVIVLVMVLILLRYVLRHYG
jgi:type VI protein secretion system component VasF